MGGGLIVEYLPETALSSALNPRDPPPTPNSSMHSSITTLPSSTTRLSRATQWPIPAPRPPALAFREEDPGAGNGAGNWGGPECFPILEGQLQEGGGGKGRGG